MLSKILPVFFSPTVIVLALLAVGLWTRRRLWFASAGALLLLVSLPIVADGLYAAAQGQVVRKGPASVSRADAVVVLGGSVEYVAGDRGIPVAEWNDAVDRFFGGLELMRAGRAPRIIFSAGAPPPPGAIEPEGELFASYARQFGIESDKVIVSPQAFNTEAEARAIRGMQRAGENRIILVTSALHMPRAMMIFEAAGFEVIPYPVDLRVASEKNLIEAWVPTPSALGKVSLVVRELIGRTYYRLMIAAGRVSY